MFKIRVACGLDAFIKMYPRNPSFRSFATESEYHGVLRDFIEVWEFVSQSLRLWLGCCKPGASASSVEIEIPFLVEY